MIEVEGVVPWSTTERTSYPQPMAGEIGIVTSDLARALRFYWRVFGLRPARGRSSEKHAIMPVTAHSKLMIHEVKAPMRGMARCTWRWGFVVTDLDRVRQQVWELGVRVSRDSGAPDHIYHWSNGRSLYVYAADGHEIELVEIRDRDIVALAPRAVAGL